MILSILICTLEERKSQFVELYNFLSWHSDSSKVEILFDCDNREISTGAKRNKLLERATGLYSVFIDDDDEVSDDYINLILKAAERGSDCIGINGTMTTNGHNVKEWEIDIGLPYIADYSKGYERYLRYPNHITPIKTEIAKQFKFADITRGEDYDWATRIHNAGVLKTSTKIHDYIYHYKYKQK